MSVSFQSWVLCSHKWLLDINLSSYFKCSLHQGNQYHFFPPIPLIKPWLISCHSEVCRNMHENFIQQLQGNGLRGSREVTKEKKKLAMFFKRRIEATKKKKKFGEGNGTPLQYSCLENPMEGGPGKAGVHGVAEGRTRLSDFTFTFHFHALEKEMATHSSVLAWRIPGMGEPDGLLSMGSHRVRHNWSDLAAAAVAARQKLLLVKSAWQCVLHYFLNIFHILEIYQN